MHKILPFTRHFSLSQHLLLLSDYAQRGAGSGGKWFRDVTESAAILIPNGSHVQVDEADTTGEGSTWMRMGQFIPSTFPQTTFYRTLQPMTSDNGVERS